MFAYKLLRK